jgi:hypothetical protein
MVAQLVPNVRACAVSFSLFSPYDVQMLTSVHECESVRTEVEPAVVVPVAQVRRRGNAVVLALGKRPVAPLLGVVDLEDPRDQAWPRRRRHLVHALLHARRVQVAPGVRVARVGPEAAVLRTEAYAAVVIAARAVRQDDVLDVVGVVTQVRPGLAIGVDCQLVVDGRDASRRVEVGHVAAKVKEIFGAERRIPTQLLPGAGWVVKGTTDGEGDGLREVADVLESLETKDLFKPLDAGLRVDGDEMVDLVDNGVDAGDAVLGSVGLDGVVPGLCQCRRANAKVTHTHQSG